MYLKYKGLICIGLAIMLIYSFLAGFWKLLRHRYYKEAILSLFVVLIIMVIVYLLLFVGGSQANKEIMWWFVVPSLALLVILVLSGLFINQYAQNVITGSSPTPEQSRRTLRYRILGWLLLIGSSCIWVYGVTHSMGETLQTLGIIVCLVLLLCGLLNVIRGTRVDSIENSANK